MDVIDAADVLGDAEGVVDRAEFGGTIPKGRLLDIGGGDFADFGGPSRVEFFEVVFESFVVGATVGDEFLIGESFAHDDVSHREEEGHIGADADGEVKVGKLGEAGSAGVGDDEFGSFGEGLFEAGGGDRMALGHVGADGEDGIGFVHVLEGIGHCTSSDLSGQTGHGGSVSGSTTVIDVVGPEAGANEFLHRVGGFVWGPPGGDAENTMSSVLRFRFRESGGGGFERFVPFDFLKGAVGLFDEGFFEAVLVLDEVVGELAFDAKGSLVGGAVHCRHCAHDFVALRHEVDGATDGAVGADRAGFFDRFGECFSPDCFFISEGSGGAGLDALAAEGAVGVAQVVVELGRDLGLETAVRDGDGVVAFLLGADSHAAVAGDALFVVAEDEGVGVLEIGGAGFFASEAPAAGSVSVDEGGEFLGGEAAEGIDIDLAVFAGDHFEERLAHLLDLGRSGFHDHAVVGVGGAGGDGIADAFDLDDAEAAAAEGIEAVIVAESGDVLFETGGDLVDCLALSECGGLAINRDGKLGGDGGGGVVDHDDSWNLSKRTVIARRGTGEVRFWSGWRWDEGPQAEGKVGFSGAGGGDVENEGFPRIDIQTHGLVEEFVLSEEDKTCCEGCSFVAFIEGIVLGKMEEISGSNFQWILNESLSSERSLRRGDGAFKQAHIFHSGESAMSCQDFLVNCEN